MATVVLSRDRFSKSFDLTQNKTNSLSEQTIKFIKALDKNVDIVCIPAMAPNEDYCGENYHLRGLYAQTSPKITSSVANPRDPRDAAKLERAKPQGYGRLVLITDDNHKEVVGQ